MPSLPPRYPRNLSGYGATPPDAQWPDGAKIAVQFVVNFEEGGENNILHGDAASEAFLSEIVGAAPWPDQRHWNMESIYEYGARAGFWRLHRMFTEAQIPVTVYGVATALARAPEQVAAMIEADWEIASHGHKWIEFKDTPKDIEREMLHKAIALHREVTGQRPTGWYLGRCSENTVRLVTEEGGFDYISDTYDDDLPYWWQHEGRDQLILPYTLDANDMRFATPQGFNSGDQFFSYLKDGFDVLYAEGQAGAAKMMNIGLHCRLIGRPGRAAALQRFIDYAKGFDGVWFPRRIDIARHWAQVHPPQHAALVPTQMDKDRFVSTYGSIFEHSPWIAERAYGLEMGPAHNTAIGVHSLLCRIFRAASDDARLGVLRAHPDLAGKLAAAKKLTAESTAEQASAGLDHLTDAERETFESLNAQYVEKFGFPFIIAVKENTKASILEAFRTRLQQSPAAELAAACAQVERIAYHRLKDMPHER